MMPLFLPPARLNADLRLEQAFTLESLCAAAGVPCRASGAWTRREVGVVSTAEPVIEAQPGSWGRVKVGVPPAYSGRPRDAARFALAVMAYVLMDPVARASVCGSAWARPGQRGRPVVGAQPNRDRQRAHRARARGAGLVGVGG